MRRTIALAAWILGWASVAPSFGASFTPLGFLGTTFGPSIAYAVSADGSTVVGETNSPQGLQAFRWRAGEGMIGLGDLPGGLFFSAAYAVSGDGSIVVGASEDASSGEEGTPFRWTQPTGMQWLGSLGGPTTYGQAQGITPDGTVIVGASQAPNGIFAFRWTAGTGMTSLGDFAGGPSLSRASGVSADGDVIAGTGSRVFTYDQAFHWTQPTGLVGIGSNSSAHAISADGLVVAGTDFQGVYRWTEGTGVVHLGPIPGGSGTYSAGATNADGSVIVGLADYDPESYPGRAFIWDADHGMRDLNAVLVQDYGLDLQGIHLIWAEGISAEGLVISGYGLDPQGEQQAWVASLESSASVPAPPAVVSVPRLEWNRPNPVVASTTIAFRLARTSPVSLRIYDESGRLVRVLLDQATLAGGEHAAAWDARGQDGHRVAAGTYFCRLDAEGTADTQRVIVLP